MCGRSSTEWPRQVRLPVYTITKNAIAVANPGDFQRPASGGKAALNPVQANQEGQPEPVGSALPQNFAALAAPAFPSILAPSG